MTDAERRQRRRESVRNCKLRSQGYDIPRKQRGRPQRRIDTTPRCPVCGCEISVWNDCRCP